MATEYKLSYTAAQIDEKLNKIDNLAAKNEMPTKTSDLINDSGFTTESYVQDYAQPAGDYALRSEIPDISVISVNGHTGEVNLTASDVGALPDTTEIPTIPVDISAFNNDVGYLTEHQSLAGLATESYVDGKIGEISIPDVAGQVAAHNVSDIAHSDIRDLVDGLTNRLNTLANSDDATLDQMSEVVAYIKSNKTLIENVTTNKVNVSDIIDNLTTNISNKPLSAAQGVVLKGLIDAIVVPVNVSELNNDVGYLTDIPSEYVTEVELDAKGYLTSYVETDPTVPAWAKSETKPVYTASEVGALPNTTHIPSTLSEMVDDSTHRTVSDDEKSAWSAKAEVSDIPTKVSDLENDSGYLTAIPSEYITETELNAKGYLTEHQSLDGYAKTTDLENLATKTEVNSLSSEVVKTTVQTLTDEQKAQARANIGVGEPIIDVVELPTENINEKALYRLLTGTWLYKQFAQNNWICYMVEILPDVGEPATTDMTTITTYYNVSDGICYGYVDSNLSSFFGVAVGWYPIGALFSAAGYTYGGVVTSIEDASASDTVYLLLEGVLYSYKDSWSAIKIIGKAGTGANAEVFNHPSNKASGTASHAEGESSHAEGESSHAEGYASHAEGYASHAEGYTSHAEGEYSHAEGNGSHAKGYYSHAEGYYSHAEGDNTHAEGINTHAEGYSSHAEGNNSHAEGFYSHAEGDNTHAEGNNSHAEGHSSHAEGNNSHAEGRSSHAKGNSSHTEGDSTHAEGNNSHAEGDSTHAEGNNSHAEGDITHAEGNNSHAEGYSSHAEGRASHTEGNNTHAEGDASHAEGFYSYAEGNNSHAEGYLSHAEGYSSHAEGDNTHANGYSSHAEGGGYMQSIIITGDANAIVYTVSSVSNLIVGACIRYTINNNTNNTAKIIDIDADNLTITVDRTLSADVALSNNNVHVYVAGLALGNNSHSEGKHTIAAGRSQHTQGEFNIIDPDYNVYDNNIRGKYAHIVGNGEAEDARSNAHTIDWAGNAWFSGDVYVGSASGTNKDTGSKKLVAAPNNMAAGDLLMYNGTTFVKLSKADLIAEIIAALPKAEEASF